MAETGRNEVILPGVEVKSSSLLGRWGTIDAFPHSCACLRVSAPCGENVRTWWTHPASPLKHERCLPADAVHQLRPHLILPSPPLRQNSVWSQWPRMTNNPDSLLHALFCFPTFSIFNINMHVERQSAHYWLSEIIVFSSISSGKFFLKYLLVH